MALLYTTQDSVKVRLAGKVQFESQDGLQDGEMPNALLFQLIEDAETEIENHLRGRYFIPFQHKNGSGFANLPDHSKRAIRMAVDMKAVMLIAATDFCRGTHVQADNYFSNLEKTFGEHLDLLMGRDREAAGVIDRFRKTPPLEGLRLANSNIAADDGVRGSVINTDSSLDTTSYAENQSSDPSRGYYVGRLRF